MTRGRLAWAVDRPFFRLNDDGNRRSASLGSRVRPLSCVGVTRRRTAEPRESREVLRAQGEYDGGGLLRVGVVSQNFPPEPAFVQGTLCAELAARGHEVRVLTGFPNFPTGRLYAGYRQRWNHQHVDGHLCVRRVPLYPSHDDSPLRRATNYLSFAASSTAASVRFLAACDVVYVYHPPVTSFAAAELTRRLHGVPAVLHVQDVWPDNVMLAPMTPKGVIGRIVGHTLEGWMQRAYATAAAIIVIGPSMRDLLIERGVDPGKVYTVLNWTDETIFRRVAPREEDRQALGRGDSCTVMYAGNLGHFQGFDVAVRAAAALSGRRSFEIVVVGSGTEEPMLRKLAGQLGADNVRFLGRRDPRDMAGLYAAADYQLVSLRNLPNLRGAIPSKLPAALACGSPVIASDGGDCARIVKDCGAGLVSPPEDWRALADRFVEATSISTSERESMGRRARQAYEEWMSMRVGVDQIEKVLLAAAEEGHRRIAHDRGGATRLPGDDGNGPQGSAA